MKRCLVHLYSTPNLLSALSALATLHPDERVAATVFVQLPGATQDVLEDLLQVVRELAHGHPSIESVEGFTDQALEPACLRDVLGAEYDEFYYTHDATGLVCRKLADTYPRARIVCIGDALGTVYPADFSASYHEPPPIPLQARLRAWLRGAGAPAPKPPAPLKPDIAVLVLPLDPSGKGLRDVELKVCRKPDFAQVLRDCHANVRGLQQHMRGLLARTEGRRRYLLLTENYAEAGHVTPDREVRMYCEVARAHCEPGSVVIVKPHPLESPGKPERIADALGADYEVIAVDRCFSRYPIEIWLELVRACTVICTAYPVLSLKYAHDIDVVQPMDDAFIERWFESAIRRRTHDSLRLYMEPLARLQHWDARSVLWSGREAA